MEELVREKVERGQTFAPEVKINKYSKFEKKHFRFCYLMVLFPVVQFAIFWAYVNFSSLIMAFQDKSGNFTLDNFKTVWQAFKYQDMFGISLKDALVHSITLWCINLFMCWPISIITTYVLFRRIPGHYAFRLCYIIPGLMGPIIWTTLVRYMVGYDGLIVSLCTKWGIELPKLVYRNGFLGAAETAFPTLCVLAFVFGIVGNNAVLTGAFARIPDELYEAAELDGAGFWRTCFTIAIPCVSSTLQTLLTFTFCGIFTADYSVYLYSGGTGQPNMETIGFQLFNLTYQIAQNGVTGAYSYGYPSALGFSLTMITLPVVLTSRHLIQKYFPAVEV